MYVHSQIHNDTEVEQSNNSLLTTRILEGQTCRLYV